MGKLVSYISILVAIDLLFLITGQLSVNSPTSAIMGAILSPGTMTTSQWWSLLITGGISLLTIGAAVIVGVISRTFEIIIFVPMAVAMAALIGDFATVFVYLANFNIVLATVVMTPIMVIFVITIVEWLRGKD
jgi:hypothetical protein